MSRGHVDHEMKERVISLAERGIPQAEIVRMTGQHRTTVSRWLWKAQRAGRNVQTRVSRFGVNVLSGDVPTRNLFRDEAAARGKTETQLINLLLRKIAADDLFDAILDGDDE